MSCFSGGGGGGGVGWLPWWCGCVGNCAACVCGAATSTVCGWCVGWAMTWWCAIGWDGWGPGGVTCGCECWEGGVSERQREEIDSLADQQHPVEINLWFEPRDATKLQGNVFSRNSTCSAILRGSRAKTWRFHPHYTKTANELKDLWTKNIF